ncbi:uncharacterized protein [Miscanthus floridulus]|uniref:uncharacterized protein n=1 Tax=Miscanthus floridulus TaxID=154761 RepID=UPI00345A3DB2
MYPYIIASGPFCLLAHFATAPYSGTDLRRVLTWRANCHHLIVVRHFRRAGGHIAATAVRVPARPRAVPRLRNIESVGLVCDGYTGTRRQRTYKFRIAELMADTGRNPSLELVIFRSDRSYWFSIPALKSPLVDWDRYRRWVPHGAVAVHSTVMWFDLSWGILSCDVEQEDFQVYFYRLPRDRGLRRGGATVDIHSKRCIAVSGGLLRYVEIIIPDPNPNGEAATVSMWSLRMGDKVEGLQWIANYSVSFQEIWNNYSYVVTGLQPEIPVLAGVCPANPDVVYFDLHHRLFGVNVPERRVVDYEVNQHELVNVPEAPLPQTGSSRYLLTWNLLRPDRATAIIGHVSPDLPEDGFPDDPKDEEPQDPKGKGKSKATDGRRKSTSASSSRPSKKLCIK